MLVTAVELVNEPADYARLIPMLQEAEEMTGVKTPLTLADAGLHSAVALAAAPKMVGDHTVGNRHWQDALIAVSRWRCRSRPKEWHWTIPTTRTGSPTSRTATHTGAPKARVLSLVRGKFSRETKKRMYQAPKRPRSAFARHVRSPECSSPVVRIAGAW